MLRVSHSCSSLAIFIMRAFSIIALCLVSAAHADGKDQRFSKLQECVQEALETRVAPVLERVIDHLNETSAAGGDAEALRRARESFEKNSEAFKKAVQESFQKVHDEFTDCMAQAGSGIQKFLCRSRIVDDLLHSVVPSASEKSLYLTEEVHEIAGEFSHLNEALARDFRSVTKNFDIFLSQDLSGCVYRS